VALFPPLSLRVAAQKAMRGVANAWPGKNPGCISRLAHVFLDLQRILKKV
jgi:hypothetical protein